jgi:L-ascorbate metabolism protein UlaG (beta-lactamase superfamily)
MKMNSNTTVQYLSWSSFLFTSPRGICVLTDPYLEGNPRLGIPACPVPIKDIVPDLIIISHFAGDHAAQAPDVMRNSEKTKILGDHATMVMMEKAGFKDERAGTRCELTTSGATFELEDFKIQATSARHISFTHLPDGGYMTGEPLCYFIGIENGPVCFFSGDTSITYDMKLWGEWFRPDIAFVGIGGVNIRGRSLDEMDPEAAAFCVEMLGVKKAIPMHYRTEEYFERFKKAVSVRAPKCECLPMKIGETISL